MQANGDESAIRFTPCTKCGSLEFSRTRITDPLTDKHFEVRTCKTCDDVTTIALPKA